MWKNFFENSATVQADHRVLALTTTTAALGMFWYARRGAGGGAEALWAALPAVPRAATTATAGLVTAQVRDLRGCMCVQHRSLGYFMMWTPLFFVSASFAVMMSRWGVPGGVQQHANYDGLMFAYRARFFFFHMYVEKPREVVSTPT